MATGGAVGAGGLPSTGTVPGLGGAPGTGGVFATGGLPGSGGIKSISTGGVVGSGGIIVDAATGGAVGSGGTGSGGTGGGGIGSGGTGSGGTGSGGTGSGGTGSGGMGRPSIVFTELRASLEDGMGYEFAGVNIGAAADDRVVIVATHSASDYMVTYSSARVGDVDAVKVASVGEDVEPTTPTALFVAAVPRGESADIRFNLTFPAGRGRVVRGAIAVFAAYGLSSTTPRATAIRISVDLASMVLDVPDGGVFVAALGMAGDATSSASWGTLTPAYGQVLVETPGTPTLLSGVCAGPMSRAGSQSINISTVGTGLNFRAVAASFR